MDFFWAIGGTNWGGKRYFYSMSHHLYAPTSRGEGLLKDRGSKFLAFAIPCQSLAEGDQYLANLKKLYHDARHHCYAYRLGKTGDTTFAADDGEPSHSAGDPILGAIRTAELTNVWVCVVRYFGGTKLGVRGLIEAYRDAAAEALQHMQREAIIEEVVFRLEYAYDRTTDINRILHPFDLQEREAVYQASVSQTWAIAKADFPALAGQLVAAQLDYEVLSTD